MHLRVDGPPAAGLSLTQGISPLLLHPSARQVCRNRQFGEPEGALVDTIDTTEEIICLRRRIDQLTQVTETLWSFLEDHGYTEQQILERLEFAAVGSTIGG